MVYLDNAATTVCKFPASAYDDVWGNANTPYQFGREAKQTADECRKRVKQCLGVKGGKVIFCSNASEAAKILCDRLRQMDIFIRCCLYEHDSVFRFGDIFGYSFVHYNDNTAVFQQWVNPVTGIVFDIPSIRKGIGNDCFLCMDATAGIGKRYLTQSIVNSVDAIWFSGHKFHGPKTGGILWVSDRLSEALDLSDDSRNEYGLKPGTLDVPSFVATVYALEYAVANESNNIAHYQKLNNYLLKHFEQEEKTYRLVDFRLPIDGQICATELLNVGCNADALVQYLSSKSIYVGLAHSACSADADYRVTQAFGISKETAERCIRVSFSEDNTFEDIDALVDGIKEFKEKFV